MPPADGPRRATLRLLGEHGVARHLHLDQPIFQIGRASESCGLVLDGPAIAPQHCCLRRQGQRWWLLDRGSQTGTYINNYRCREPTELHDGDRISIGLHLLEFRTTPARSLQATLARLGDTSLDLDPGLPPPPAAHRPRRPLRAICLATAVAFAVTLSIAANVQPEPRPSLETPGLPQDSRSAPVPPDSRSAPVPQDSRPAPVPQDSHSAPVPQDSSLAHILGRPSAPGPTPSRPSSLPGPTEYLTEPPIFELPADAVTRGRPSAGALLHALQLPVSPDYIIRCPAHAYASAATATELIHALATFRNRSGYRGEIVIGDLSQEGGGRYGPHKSHQSGRDVDLWLPVLGGTYRRGCVRCGTDLCRPEPAEVDWKITWQLIQALASRGTVQDIFLAWELQPALRDAALELGAPQPELTRQIQHPIRGRAALVKHADGHTHHLHIRFRCPAGDTGCTPDP